MYVRNAKDIEKDYEDNEVRKTCHYFNENHLNNFLNFIKSYTQYF